MSTKSFRILIFFVFIAFTSVFPAVVYSNDKEAVDLKVEKINPGSMYYPLKRFIEKTIYLFSFSNELKFEFSKSLVDSKMSELKYVIENDLRDQTQSSTERLAYFADQLASQASGQNKEKREEILIKLENYKNLLGNLRDKYPANSSYWLLVQHDINTFNKLTDELKKKEE
jgi:hypothetical protein